MTTPNLRWALAGYGVGGQVFHAPLIQYAEGLDLVAVVSANPQRAQEVRARGLLYAGDIAALPGLGVDGVTITTPAATHSALAHAALDAGLHVVVDKPFALTVSEAASVVEHAKHAGLMLSVYQNRRWDGDFLSVADLINSAELGAIRRFTTRIERFRPDLPPWTLRASAADGGGVLVDLGPHLIDQAVHLFGPVTAVSAELSRFDPNVGAEDDMLLSLNHVCGVKTCVLASYAAAARGPRFQLNGDLGGCWVNGFDVQEHQLFAGETPQSLGPGWGREPDDRALHVITPNGESSRALLAGQWTAYYPAIARAVRGDGPVPVDPADAVHTCEIFDAARQSAAQRRWIDLTVKSPPR